MSPSISTKDNDDSLSPSFSQLYNPQYANVEIKMKVIAKMDAPRQIKKMRVIRHRVHKGRKPVMNYDKDMQMYFCECGNWILPQHKEEHEKL